MRSLTPVGLCFLLACNENSIQPSTDNWLMVFEPAIGQTTFRIRPDSTTTINVTFSDSTGAYPHSANVKFPSWTSRLYYRGVNVGAFNGGFSPVQSDGDTVRGSGIWTSDSIQAGSGYFFIYRQD